MRVVIALLVLVAAGSSRAEMPAHVAVAGEGECPSPPSLARALERLHPALHADGGDVRVEVFDRGASYEVHAGERTRTLADPGRRCTERATAAALAVTLLLDPPSAPPPEEPEGPLAPRESPPPPAPSSAPSPSAPSPSAPSASAPLPPAQPPSAQSPSAQPPAPTPRPVVARVEPPRVEPARVEPTVVATRPGAAPAKLRRPSRIDLELVGLVDGAPALATTASEVTGGAALRLSVGGRYVAGTLGFTGLAPATANFTAPNIAVTVVRLPFDAGVRLLLPSGRVEPGIDAGLTLAILQLSAPSLDGATTNTRLDVGARIAPFLRIGLTQRLALVAGVQMIVSFAPYDLVVTGAGQIGTTPRLWLGGGIGLVARL